MPKWTRVSIVSCCLALLLCGCSRLSWDRCPSDAEVLSQFEQMKAPLARLQLQLAADKYKVVYLSKLGVETDARGPGLSIVERALYLDLLRELGDVVVNQHDGVITVVLWVDQTRLGAWSRDKMITFTPEGSSARERYRKLSIPSLDGLEKQGKAGAWVRSMDDGWYMVYTEGD